MGEFSYKSVYEENGKKILEVDVLPEKLCNFSCIFCPLPPLPQFKATDTRKKLGDLSKALQELAAELEQTQADVVFINSQGEALLYKELRTLIDFIHVKGKEAWLFSNGYLLGVDPFKSIANECERVIGEIKTVTEEDFLQAQRPVSGYSLKSYITHMSKFRRQYKGRFELRITLLHGYNDDAESVGVLQAIVQELQPDLLKVLGLKDPRFQAKLGVSEERLAQVYKDLVLAQELAGEAR